MEKEYFGKFMAKDENRVFKTDCRVVLNDNKISLYYEGKNGVKFREYKAETIFSFEEEKLIKISENKNLFNETLLSFFGAIALVSNFWLGAAVIAFSFCRVILKSKKSYILLLNPIRKPVLQLIKCRGIKQNSQIKKAA